MQCCDFSWYLKSKDLVSLLDHSEFDVCVVPSIFFYAVPFSSRAAICDDFGRL